MLLKFHLSRNKLIKQYRMYLYWQLLKSNNKLKFNKDSSMQN